MSEHTPLPWYLAKDNYWVDRIWDANLNNDICSCAGDGSIEHETRKANAEFIVRACNAHDDLLAACRAALDEMEHLEESDKLTYFDTETLRLAIAKAEGQS